MVFHHIHDFNPYKTNIVIADPTRVDLLHQYCATQGFVAFNATQTKEKNCVNNTPLINSSP
jgi:hypothetical protein